VIFDLFSKRKKKAASQNIADVYQYETVSVVLRNQVQQILVESIGPQYRIVDSYLSRQPAHNPDGWEIICKTLCRELGQHNLGVNDLAILQVMRFLETSDVDGFVDVVELCSRMLFHVIKPMESYRREQLGIKQAPDDAIEEINYRFREARLGFQFENGTAFQMDSEFAHEEIIKPALRILSVAGFEGAREEFLTAHRHYRAGENEQAIVELAKAFESTLKAVCDKKGWPFDKGARATDLLKLVQSKGLWPDYLDGSFDQLLATLKSGLPKMRNEQAAHGQGQNVRITPRYVVTYALNLAAAKIVFIADAANSAN
jgi:AbiJ N-terminal domain 4